MSSVNSRALNLSWSPPLPPRRNGVIISYLITCSSGGSIINSTRTSSTSLTITGLQPFTNYACSITAHTRVGGGPAATINLTTLQDGLCNDKNNLNHIHVLLVPGGPPVNFTIFGTSHNITLFWSSPLPSQRNGVIISYLITCSSGGSIINSTRTSSTSLTITGLQPFNNYTCSVRAATIVGDGLTAMKIILTNEESKCLSSFPLQNNMLLFV